jgi:hypothetical protein
VYQFRDLIEINPKGAKLKEIFNCLGVQLPNFQSSGVKKKMSIAAETLPLLVESLAAETPPLLVEQPCLSSPSRFNSLKICNGFDPIVDHVSRL